MARRKTIRKTKPNNQPDYVLKMHPKGNFGKDYWTKVGAAWVTDNGLKIELERGVVLEWRDFHVDNDGSNYVLMLLENDK